MFKRYFIFLIGLLINSIGVSFVTKASLGTSPISAIPYVLSLNFPLTLGEFTILFSLLLIALQILILGKSFKLSNLLQIPVSLVFGYFIDISMILLGFIKPTNYLVCIIYLIIGCGILGVGVYIEVLANVIMLPGESFVRAVVHRWKTEFGLTKICFDSSVSIIAAILSFVFTRELNGVREGTLIAALLVGYTARILNKKLSFLSEKLFGAAEAIAAEGARSASSVCLCIGRQFGSGGRALAKQLAEELGYEFYDKNIIKLASDSVNYSEHFIENMEERMNSPLLYDLGTQVYDHSGTYSSPKDLIFKAESDVIRSAAEKNCVIIGRCADWLLKDQPNCIRVFLTAPLEDRIKRVMKRENISEKAAAEKVPQIDKLRAVNYKYYTGQTWGASSNYQICLDTSLGEEYVLNTIKSLIKEKASL